VKRSYFAEYCGRDQRLGAATGEVLRDFERALGVRPHG
jgi:hypothetical protein